MGKYDKLDDLKKELYIFKYYFNQMIGNTDDSVNEYTKNNISKMREFFIRNKAYICAKEYNQCSENRKLLNPEFDSYYNNILDKWVKLSKEIPLYDSLEVSILFSHLLWNGYFSKNHSHTYSKVVGTNTFDGLFSLDIINGKGVCLNYSNMLKDLLIKSGYEAAIVANSMNVSYLDYKIDFGIKMNFDININLFLLTIFSKLLGKKSGNHANVLICENDKLYIYDPTNLACSNVVSLDKAVLIDGDGTLDLKPDMSYLLASNFNEMKTIDKLINYNNCVPLYDKDRIYNSWGVFISLFNNNYKLINDCYYDTLPDLLKISNNMEKIKSLSKTEN